MTTPAAVPEPDKAPEPNKVPATDEAPDDQEEIDQEERLFRQVMDHVTDQVWTAGVHHFVVAMLHDIVGFVLSQQQAHLKCHERQPES